MTFEIALSMFLVGGAILLIPLCFVLIRKFKWRRCTVEVDAVVSSLNHVGYDAVTDPVHSDSYYPVFKYTYNNQEYNIQSNYPCNTSKLLLHEGDKVKIMINPNKPNEFIREEKVLNRNLIIVSVMSAIPTLIGLINLIAICLNN